MISIAMSKVIRCQRARVWRALVSPDELIRWDRRRVALVEPVPDWPAPGQPAHWRCALGSVTVDRCEDPQEVVPGKRLRTAVRLGSFEFEETYTLSDDTEPGSTRLSLRMSAKNSVPLLAGALDRFDVRRLSTEQVDAALAGLQRWCEAAES